MQSDRVIVEPTTGEQLQQGKSRAFVVMLDGNRVGDFDDRKEADATRLDIVRSLERGYSLAGLKDKFEELSVMHAKMSAKYRDAAKECEERSYGQNVR